MTQATDIILASASPSRRKLLESAGVVFRTVFSGVDEAVIKRDHAAIEGGCAGLALRLAREKALAVASRYPDALVIGADQVLVFDGEPLDKPNSVETARRQLLRLRGKRHSLDTAVACARGNGVVWTLVEAPLLSIREFSPEFIESYVAAEGLSVTETVGGYKIEGRGIQLFDSMAGDYFAILGLPLLPLLAFLRAEGALAT